MKIELNDDLILFSTDGGYRKDELRKECVKIQIEEYSENYATVNIDTLIRSLEAMKTRE